MSPLAKNARALAATQWILAALVANAVQMLAGRLAGTAGLTVHFFAVHLVVTLVSFGALALACRLARETDAYAIWAGTLPIALAIVASTASRPLRFAGLVAALGVALLARRRLPRLHVISATLVGATVAVAIRWFRLDHFAGSRTSLKAVATFAGVCVVALAITRLLDKLEGMAPAAARVSFAALFCAIGSVAALERTPHVRHPGPAAPAPSAPPVVVIVLDTVRADHLASYGYGRATMPGLDRFAQDHLVRVERSVANSSWTVPTHASLFTGLVPPRHGAGMGPLPATPSDVRPLAPDCVTLAELFAARGYQTTAVSANHAALQEVSGFGRHFHSFRSVPDTSARAKLISPWTLVSPGRAPLASLNHLWPFARVEFFEPTMPYRRARDVTDEAIGAIDAAGDRPFFLFVNYMDAHWPYNAPGAYRRRFAAPEPPYPRLWTVQAFDDVLMDRRDLTPGERQELVDLYDGGLNYLDSQLARLLDVLSHHPRWSETILVVTADHGEAFGEHRLIHHGRALYEELLRTPLFIRPRAATDGARKSIAGPMQTVDLFATILELAGLPQRPGIDGLPWGRGRTSVAAWIDPNESTRGNPRFTRPIRSLEIDGVKLIQTQGEDAELYDLVADPAETRNLAAARPAEVAARELALGPWHMVESVAAPLDAQRTEELRALGYVQ